MTAGNTRTPSAPDGTILDAIIIGAGFGGLYMLHRLRQSGLKAHVFEAGADVGGTWYWNRYPGARCDVESVAYCYSFSPEITAEWNWSEKFATQPEILDYLRFAADRLDLRRDISFNARVTAAHYDEGANLWRVTTASGRTVSARYCIAATGCLSASRLPDIPGIDRFKGQVIQSANWPEQPMDFKGKRVGIIGTGSTGIQIIPVVAAQAGHTSIFQRTPAYSVPARNALLSDHYRKAVKEQAPDLTRQLRAGLIHGNSDLRLRDEEPLPPPLTASQMTTVEQQAELERRWQRGGAWFMFTFADQVFDRQANEVAAEFIRTKIRQIVRDRAVAEKLCPGSYAIGAKRICVDTDYYATYNRPNVTLLDHGTAPILEVTEAGIRTGAGDVDLDIIIFATGFDAMTGALLSMDIRGRNGMPLAEKWRTGPRTYLGLGMAGFPNLFTITGPGSPSVFSNVVVSIEQHVEWIGDCLDHLRAHGMISMEPTEHAEDEWVRHVGEVAGATLIPTARSWYVGANIPGKPNVFMIYVGGVGAYRDICDKVAADGYAGFTLLPTDQNREEVA
ncbi:flavin-containing monooxygenase [Niveispirillum sp. KHB5.9]|uniref:flavin-containing monooxygenase n=1 Tax=Niveispirillum sp. KHB5.9 TaxID=3400269 RepID=UPI003A8B0901